MNPFVIKDTYDLIRTVEKFKAPATYLLDQFFSQKEITAADYLPIETLKNGRRLAPYVGKGSKGLNVLREGSTVRMYKPPCIGARRTISLDDISMRQFGETPVFSSKTAAERAAEMQARDLQELIRMIANRKNQMAAELLTTGKITVREYGDDGKIVKEEAIVYDADNVIHTDWQAADADIYGDIKAASEYIQEGAGAIPTLMVCGANIEKYLLANKPMRQWLFNANANATAYLSYEPKYSSPQTRYLGTLGALNLEMYVYLESYLEDGETKPFLDADSVIIGIPQKGRQVYGAVTYLEEGGDWQTAAAENVPIYNFNTAAQQTNLTVLSRFLPVPEDIDDWRCLKVAQKEGLPRL